MSQPHIDVKEIRWFKSVTPVEITDTPCDHDCKHLYTAVVAWGPTKQTYELILCNDCGCYGWNDYRSEDYREDRWFWRDRIEWRKPIAPPPPRTPHEGKVGR